MNHAEKRLLQLLLGNPELQCQFLPKCSIQDFEGLAAERIFSSLLREFEKNQLGTYEGFHRLFAGEKEQDLLAELEIEESPESPSLDAAERFLNAFRTKRLAALKQRIRAEIAQAAERNDDEMLKRLLEQSGLVDRELVSLSRK
jgi:hypothetical protein